MPTQTLSGTLTNLSYEDLTNWINITSSGNADIDAWISACSTYGVDEMQAVEDLAGAYMNFYKDGNGRYTITSFNNIAQVNNVSPVDSNISTISRGNVQSPLNRAVDSVTGKLNITRYPASGSLAQRAGYILGSVGSAFAAVSTGISLGKVIDSTLYNVNPDYWDSIGMSSLNPETWNSITNGDNSLQAGLFNMILGLDPETGNSQMYMDQNAFAYLAYTLSQNGWFDTGDYTYPATPATNIGYQWTSIFTVADVFNQAFSVMGASSVINSSNIDSIIAQYGSYKVLNYEMPVLFSNLTTGSGYLHIYCTNADIPNPLIALTITSAKEIDIYYELNDPERFPNRTGITNSTVSNYTGNVNKLVGDFGTTTDRPYLKIHLFGGFDITASSPIDGVSNQDNAVLPDVSNWNDIPSTLDSLQQQYPSLFANPLVWDNVQPDGTNPQLVYIPVATPTTNNALNQQPIGGDATQTQQNTQIQPTTDPQTLLDLISRTMTQPNPHTETATDTDTQTPPANPTDTGTGSTQTPTAPTGSASALWSVYHPTQAQINSFGAWLWGSPFLTNIGKLFQNPIDGVISLHKVFATPVDSGTGTIVVGTLDSNVSSATVNQQYIEVDCGSVNCFEDFGNVFDYEPYTKVSLYLPFIGIVPLNVSDVMRSTISITYGVDVFTGACIAMIEVSRDGGTINMYQYTGNCAVHYPLSNVQQSQLISGLLGIAAGVGSVRATGGVSAPAVLGMAGGALAAGHTSIGRSGGFSANAGAMGIKVPYLIIERPQTKVAETFPYMDGYPTNYSVKLGSCSNHVVCKTVHVYGINATESELAQIEQILKDGVEV